MTLLRTFTRIALRVKNEIEEELHRQEGTEDQDESEEDISPNHIAPVEAFINWIVGDSCVNLKQLVEELTVEKSESLDPRLCSFCQWVVNLLGLC